MNEHFFNRPHIVHIDFSGFSETLNIINGYKMFVFLTFGITIELKVQSS